MTELSQRRFTWTYIFDFTLNILMVLSHVYIMKRLTNSTNLVSLSSSSLFLECLKFRGVDHRCPACTAMFHEAFSKVRLRGKQKLQFLRNSCYSSLISATVLSFQLAFSGLTQHLSCLIVRTPLITTVLLVSSPPLSLWAQRGDKIKPYQVGLPARMRCMSCKLATPPGILIPVQQSVHAFVLHPTF